MGVRWIDTGRVADLSSTGGKRVTIDGQSLVLWKVGEQVVAAENLCPHQHLDTLHLGPLEDGVVTCPMHGWSFALDSGKAVVGSGRLKLFPVQVQGERILVGLDDGS